MIGRVAGLVGLSFPLSEDLFHATPDWGGRVNDVLQMSYKWVSQTRARRACVEISMMALCNLSHSLILFSFSPISRHFLSITQASATIKRIL